MSYLIFSEKNVSANDTGMITQCTSAIFNYQVVGEGTVEFSGSNIPTDDLDIDNENHWIPILSLDGGMADSDAFRQHCWNSLRYKVVSGQNIGIYVSSGVSG